MIPSRLPKLDDIRYSPCHCRARRLFSPLSLPPPSSLSLSLLHSEGYTDGQVQARNVALHESAHDHDRISSGLGSTESDGVIDDGRDLSIETRTRRQGGSVARAVGVSLPRRAGPLFDSLLPLSTDYFRCFRSLLESLRARSFFTSNSSCRRKLHRIFLE